ncbi:unnamed protein product [Heterobilharzia americana]|nr:unnamed protein product [Heterobilharzia americana]
MQNVFSQRHLAFFLNTLNNKLIHKNVMSSSEWVNIITEWATLKIKFEVAINNITIEIKALDLKVNKTRIDISLLSKENQDKSRLHKLLKKSI